MKTLAPGVKVTDSAVTQIVVRAAKIGGVGQDREGSGAGGLVHRGQIGGRSAWAKRAAGGRLALDLGDERHARLT